MGLIKDKIGGKIMKEIVVRDLRCIWLSHRWWSCWQRGKEQKIKLLDCNSRIIEQEHNRIILRSQRRFRSEKHNLFTEKINKILLSVNYDKRIQTSNGVATYLLVYGCHIESLEYTNI